MGHLTFDDCEITEIIVIRSPLRIVSPPAGQAGKFKRLYQDSLDRLNTTDPALYHEVKAIVRDVILVAGDASQTYQFAGGSSYMLWGALFINASMSTNSAP